MNGQDRLLIAKLIYYVFMEDTYKQGIIAKLLLIRLNLPKFKDEKDFERLKEC